MDSIKKLSETIHKKYHDHTDEHIFTVAISGIDASGKGYITKLLQKELEKQGLKVANINIDPWQNPITVRLQKENAAENFYNQVFRWNDFFTQLIIPLREKRSICLEARLIRTHADEYYPFVYNYRKLDILLVEGIFLLKKEFLHFYDYKIWVACSYETGLQRAIVRNIEKLNINKLICDYNTFYYPAQRLHLAKDKPILAADMVFNNNKIIKL